MYTKAGEMCGIVEKDVKILYAFTSGKITNGSAECDNTYEYSRTQVIWVEYLSESNDTAKNH